MIQCWPSNRWRRKLRKAEVRVTLGRETRVPGMQTRLAEVTHLGDKHQTRPDNSRMLRRHNSNNNSHNNSNNISNNNHNNNSNNISSSTSSNRK